MTRPTENQLAEALEALCEEFVKVFPIYYYAEPWAHDRNKPLLDAKLLLSAYRSAQQAEAGAAGELPEPAIASPCCGFGYSADQMETMREAGRQQGMEQARAEIDAAQTAAYAEGRKDQAEADGICQACAGSGETEGMAGKGPDTWTVTVPCGKCGGTGDAQPAASSAQSSKPDPQSSRVGMLDKAASSAQEPGWVMVPELPTREMLDAGANCVNMNYQQGNGVIAGYCYRHMLAAAPTRLAGAAQGEVRSALQWAAERSMAVTKEWARGWDDCRAAHPQAQVERKPLSEARMAEIVLEAAQMWNNSTSPHPSKSVITGRLVEAAHGIGIPTASTASDEGSV